MTLFSHCSVMKRAKLARGVVAIAAVLLLCSCVERERGDGGVSQTSESITVASFNIWSPGGRSGVNGAKGNDREQLLWPMAYVAVADCIKANDPDVIGLNEVGDIAYSTAGATNIQTFLPGYSWILYKKDGTVVRTPAEKSNIYSLSDAILYKSSVLTLLDRGVFWTTGIDAGSNGPNVPEGDPLYGLKAYDYATNAYVDMCTEERHCVWAKFEHKATEKKFYVFCLHNDLTYSYTDVNGNRVTDEQSQCANASVVLHHAGRIVPEGIPSVILGDFNATAGDTSFDLFRDSGRWKDAYETVARREGSYKTSGVSITTMNKKDNATLSATRPDHILTDGFNVSSYAVDRTKYENVCGYSIYPSDHFLVKTVIEF